LVAGGRCCAVGDHCSRFRSAEKYLSCHEKLARVSRDEDVTTCQSLVLMTKQFSTENKTIHTFSTGRMEYDIASKIVSE